MVKTMRNASFNNQQPRRANKSAAEKRFNGIKNRIHSARTEKGIEFDKQLQEDLAYQINHIESYGFGFVPNHYLMDELDKLENIIGRVDPTRPKQRR